MTDSTVGAGPMELLLTQSGSSVTGTARLMQIFEGTLAGNIVKQRLTLVVSGMCTLTMNGTRTGNTLAGTYVPGTCPGTSGGAFAVVKQ